jgi:hypothetical protein
MCRSPHLLLWVVVEDLGPQREELASQNAQHSRVFPGHFEILSPKTPAGVSHSIVPEQRLNRLPY